MKRGQKAEEPPEASEAFGKAADGYAVRPCQLNKSLRTFKKKALDVWFK